jgi:hypothetical protein
MFYLVYFNLVSTNEEHLTLNPGFRTPSAFRATTRHTRLGTELSNSQFWTQHTAS